MDRSDCQNMVNINVHRRGRIITFTILETGQTACFKDRNSRMDWKEHLSIMHTNKLGITGFLNDKSFAVFSTYNGETSLRIKHDDIDVKVEVSNKEALPILRYISG